VLQVVGREHETINYSSQELRDIGDVCRSRESQDPRPCTRGCGAMRVGWEVTVEVIIDNGMLDLRPNGADNGHLRCNLWARFGKIYHQERINGP